MFLDVFSGALCAALAVLCLLYPLCRKRGGGFASPRLHRAAGWLLLAAAALHVNVKIAGIFPSFGFAALLALAATAVAGVCARRMPRARWLRGAHLVCAGLFLLLLAMHAAQRLIDLLLR